MDSPEEESDIVSRWLSSANLSYAIPNFRMAGIVSPRSFVELELNYFEPLGVTKADDRKRLFYLIHKVKGVIEEDEKNRNRRNNSDDEIVDEGEKEGATASMDGDDDDDEYAGEEFQSPESNSREEEEEEDTAESRAGRMMSSVEIRRAAAPISPVTLSSPIASEDGRPYGATTFPGVAEEGSAAASSGRRPGVTGAQAAAAITSRPTSASTRERLERELEMRALRRRQEKLAAREELCAEYFEEGVGTDSTISTSDSRDGGRSRRMSGRGRQSSIPAGGSVSSFRGRRRSSIASYRTSSRAAGTRKAAVDRSDAEEKLEEEKTGELHARFGEEFKLGDSETDHTPTPADRTGNTAVDVRARSSSIGMHHRRTVKKTNATNRTKKNRRLSGIPRAAAPPLTEDEEENGSVASETSDLSASLHSLHSVGNGSAGGGGASSAGSSPSRVLGGRADENRNNYREERGRSTRKQHALSRGATVKGGGGGGSVESLSLRDRHAALGDAGGSKKRLSTIPSSAVAPLSPLAGMSSTQLEESMNAASVSQATATGRNPTRRRSGLGLSGKQGASSSSSGRPGTAESKGSRKKPANKGHRSGAGGRGSPGSVTSNGSRASSRDRLRRKLHVSTSSASVSSSSSTVQRRRLASPAARRNDAARTPRSRSPYASSRGATPPRTATRSISPKRTPPQKMGAVRVTSPPRANRSASPKRTHRAGCSPSKQLAAVGRPLSPIRGPRAKGGLTSPGRSPRRVKSPLGGNGGAVFVHGAPADESWATQIGQLREAFDVEHRELMEERKDARDEEDDGYEMRIRVIVRKRPMSDREAAGAEVDVIHPLDYDDYGRILVHQAKTKLDLTKEVDTTAFAFDNVFDERSNNVQIYERSVMSLIPGVFRGKWASVFAYGQTGSGKTFTMMGSNATGMRAGNQSSNVSDANLGLYFLAAQDVFRIAENPAYANISIGVSLFEIYGGKLLDLLNGRNPVRCLENSKGRVCFPGLSEHPVTDAEELMDVIDAGALNRSTGTTSANADSSRSHAVLQLSLRKDVGRIKNKEHGRLTFIDLAGSERGADTSKACRTTRMEGAEINTSLLALKEVIRALATGSSLKRIPFRGSKLTQVLKESFVGKNSRTVMVSCVAPNMKNCDHTLNTLRYADRVKERDSQTGKLSASVAASSKIKRDQEEDIIRVKLPPRPLTAPAASFRIAREDESDDDIPPPPSNEKLLLESLEECTFVEEEEEIQDKSGYSGFDYDKIVESDGNDSLEEALKSNDNLPAIEIRSHSHHKSTIPRPQPTLKDNAAAQSLIATHKNIMAKLLQMLQHEMSLVNDTDANRENIDEYMKELENISGRQLTLLSTLRESLVSYNESKDGNRSAAHTSPFNNLSNDDTTDYDDSFDLRD